PTSTVFSSNKNKVTHDDAIWSVAWGTNKKENSETVVTGSLDDLVKVWKWCDERLDLQWSLEGHQLGVVSVDISHTLPIAASSSLDAHIRLWDLDNGKQIKSIDAGPVDAWTLAFSPDSQYLATGTHVGKVNIFGVESGKKEYSLDTRGKFILSIAYVRNPCSLFSPQLYFMRLQLVTAAVWLAQPVVAALLVFGGDGLAPQSLRCPPNVLCTEP
uniref:Superkiller complex protein 8 n=1 Tax=Canis lupus familiaris TaxID=9615 RepID=A0A8C0RVD8_CANLF